MIEFLQLAQAGGTSLVTAVIVVYFMTRQNARDIAELKKSCVDCRTKIEARLDEGSDEFSKTRENLLSTSKDAAIDNARMREEFFQRFITEATFKDRVVATMMAACPNCRKGGG